MDDNSDVNTFNNVSNVSNVSNLSNDVVYEVRKELSVSNIMQLVDLNGTKKNFQSQFILETDDPSKKISICVVNQDELDNGKINFEETENGKYARKVTYRNNKHVNHYIALKKHPEDTDNNNVDCILIIHMKELPPPSPKKYREDNMSNMSNMSNISNRDDNEESYPPLNPNMSNETKENIRQKLFKLRDDQEYQNMPSIPTEFQNPQNPQNISISKSNNSNNKPSIYTNSYFYVGLILLCAFAYIFYSKKIKK